MQVAYLVTVQTHKFSQSLQTLPGLERKLWAQEQGGNIQSLV